MAKTLKEIEEEYFHQTTLVEITDKEEINRMANSKTSCCWHAGERVGDDWVMLCTPSKTNPDGKPVTFVCRIENYPF